MSKRKRVEVEKFRPFVKILFQLRVSGKRRRSLEVDEWDPGWSRFATRFLATCNNNDSDRIVDDDDVFVCSLGES